MATACRTGHCSVHRVRLPVHQRRITGMGGGRHRLLQGILQVHLPDCLFPAGSGDTILSSQPSALLTMPEYETDVSYCKFRKDITERGSPNGRLLLFFHALREWNKRKRRKRRGKEGGKKASQPGTTGQSWQALLFGRQGRTLRFRKKSSSLRCGIFPENLAFPKAFAVGPS